MPSLKAIRKRVSSVKSTQQITKAMKMVAAAKLRRAQMAAVSARPYAEKLEELVKHLLERVDPDSHPLMRTPSEAQRGLILFVTSDRGLCGGYNANLSRSLDAFLREHPGEWTVVTSGRKGLEHIRRHGRSPLEHFPMPPFAQASELAAKIAAMTTQAFLAEKVDQVYIVYSAFKSALSQVPTIERLLPLERDEEDPGIRHDGPEYLFEPGPKEIVGMLLPKLLEVRILHALLEAGASELAARMAAMDSATRNASEMIDRLTLEMNRARQAAITKELMEIIGGAEALNG